ncbi:MAG: hypothetical protein KF857_01770 [Fimbriimonadaceae bacterium]|nr:hypothetical protein [Fimbriimonadaceae bacterium]
MLTGITTNVALRVQTGRRAMMETVLKNTTQLTEITFTRAEIHLFSCQSRRIWPKRGWFKIHATCFSLAPFMNAPRAKIMKTVPGRPGTQ